MAYSQKFKAALKFVLASEGGNDDDPNDEGGRTGQGIIQSEFNRWLASKGKSPRDVWTMTPAERDAIYFDFYWAPLLCEDVPLPMAYMLFDTGVHQGINFAPKAFQQGVGVLADGAIGPVTKAAAKAQDPLVAWSRLRAARWARMQTRKSFEDFKKGWKKRLDDVEANVKSLVRLR